MDLFFIRKHLHIFRQRLKLSTYDLHKFYRPVIIRGTVIFHICNNTKQLAMEELEWMCSLHTKLPDLCSSKIYYPTDNFTVLHLLDISLEVSSFLNCYRTSNPKKLDFVITVGERGELILLPSPPSLAVT